ncbi:MAG: hypothetical protein IJ682_01235 [Lachnospiraceae bacterium]|nr:hypothetical protein [Lachnospiraceae bacterium]
MNAQKQALQNFAFDAAAGRAIRHLCDLGMSAEEIHGRLDFPVPMERLRSEIRKYEEEKAALESGEAGQYRIVKEYGKYGRTTFRRVKIESADKEEKADR